MYIKNYLKINELKDGYLYKIIARNALYGIWIAEEEAFLISRIKFGDNFLFKEYHYDCPAFATAQPVGEVEKSPFDPKNLGEEKDVLEYLNKFEGERDNLKPAWMKPKWTQR